MKRFLMAGVSIALLSSCTTQKPIAYPIIDRDPPKLVQVPIPRGNFQLVYGNDAGLERAFTQYTSTGKAPNIITAGFIKFAYNAGQQPIIKATPFEETVISLEPGEKFTNISSGDPNRWSYAVAVSGSAGKPQQNVLIKPSLPDIATNLVITTDRRIYNIRMVSSMKTHPTKIVSFWYPDEMVHAINAASIQQPLTQLDSQVGQQPLNFNYRISCGWLCSNPSWTPARVFDDGTHTYIQFSPEITNRDLPILFTLEGNSKELVNYRSKPPYFIVDKIFRDAVLVMGVGRSQTSVSIKNIQYT